VTPGAAPPLRARVAVALALGALAAALVATRSAAHVSDFDPVWAGARALRAGANPYAAVGPGRDFYWPWGLYYPLPALLLALPFSFLTVVAARATFFGLSSALLAFAVTREGYHRLPLFASGAMMAAAGVVQWSPLVTAAALLPWLGAALVVKPNLGGTLWLAYPSRRAAVGVALLLLVSLAVRPSWVAEWLAVIGSDRHMRPPLLSWAGPPLLLAVLRWRRPEARLLLLLACVPQTVALYDTLPLFLIPATWLECAALALLTHVAQLATLRLGPFASFDDFSRVASQVNVALVFLPCLVIVLRRPNTGELPSWFDAVAAGVRTGIAGRLARSREAR
jgi:hypothetical protein